MQFRAKQIAAPKEWGTFEDLCHVLFKRVWQDPLAQKNGRRGQAQAGVDIFGSSGSIRESYWGVQCKGKDRNYGSQAEWAEVLAEIQKAEKFSPPLTKWIFATTAPVDAHLQKAARELSVKRHNEGLFSIEVLGWDEILALMAEHPEVINEFYPEHSDRNVNSENEKSLVSHNQHGSATWVGVTFDSNRGLGPALMGYALGPSDAAACPALNEVASVLALLDIAYSARLVGEPGAGKSICSYQVAKQFADKGFEVFRLLDPQSDDVALVLSSDDKNRLYLIDDAHLLKPHVLTRIEERASPNCLVLSTHNAIENVSHRGAITLDAKRAVKTIAASLRTNLYQTLEAVRLADDDVGERMMDTDIQVRLDQAESSSERPWQFCFVLGGGWRRSKQAADSARVAKSDIVLAAIAIRQIISRDARATSDEIVQVCNIAGIEVSDVVNALNWLSIQRLIISITDCRTPHQRFASVVLKRVLEGQGEDGRRKIGELIESMLIDEQYPYAGLRILIHELRFGSGNYSWKYLLGKSGVEKVIARLWLAEGVDRGYAALALSDLWYFVEGGAKLAIGPNVTTLAKWISSLTDGAFGFGDLLNNLTQENKDIAKKVVELTDPLAISFAYSNVTIETAYSLAELIRGIVGVRVEYFNNIIKTTIDRSKLIQFSKHEAFLNKPFIFANFCASVVWLDEELALEMAEAFLPTAQLVLVKDPFDGFKQISHDFVSTVLRAFDVLGIYVGKYKPSKRHLRLARILCEKIEPQRVVEHISTLRHRNFKSASYFLSFFCQFAPRKYDAVIRELDWDLLDSIISDDWVRMPHDTEVLLCSLSGRLSSQDFVKRFISKNTDRIIYFTPKLMLLNPEAGISHLSKGRELLLGNNGSIDWYFSSIALDLISKEHSEFVESVVSNHIDEIARRLTVFNRDFTDSAEAFVRIVIEYAPTTWHSVLTKLDLGVVEKNFTDCLTGNEAHRKTIAAVVESAIALDEPIGVIARRLRKKYPRASSLPKDI